MADYTPDPESQKLIREVNDKCEQWRRDRQPHEQQWFINSAFIRGQHYVVWNDKEQRLTVPPAPSHRIRLTINRIFPKVRARRAKFLKNRPSWVVIPATTDQQDKLDARATQKALDFQWRRLKMEAKYREALGWAEQTGRGYWWYYWDPGKSARIMQTDPMGMKQVVETQAGDIGVEVGSPFELLVADPTIPHISRQPEVMRIKMRPVEEMKSRYPALAEFIEGQEVRSDLFRYEKQISALNGNNSAYGGTSLLEERTKAGDHRAKVVLVKEHLIAPTPAYQKGRYRLVIGDVLAEARDELPYGFADMDNPYPVTEFMDVPTAGQYWGPTVVEQLIGLQREYNLVRSKIAEQIRTMVFPKLIVAKQHQIPDGAWTSEAGEVIEYVAIPGVPPPTPYTPANIANDAWRILDLIRTEFEDVTQIYPAAEGKTGGATSGFQTDLLQEATDSVHAPDARGHELALEDAALKIRRLMKLGYDVPRLLTIVGINYEPEVVEFSQDDINEHCDIIVEAGSALPKSKAAKIASVMELYDKQILGDPQDPETKRRTLQLLELGGVEEEFDFARRDEELARIENTEFIDNKPVPFPEFYQNHQIHYAIHTDQLKNAAVRHWPEQQRLTLIAHVIKHVEFMNPLSAAQLAMEYNLLPLLKPETIQLMQQPQPVMGGGESEGGQPPSQEGASNVSAEPGPTTGGA